LLLGSCAAPLVPAPPSLPPPNPQPCQGRGRGGAHSGSYSGGNSGAHNPLNAHSPWSLNALHVPLLQRARVCAAYAPQRCKLPLGIEVRIE
jgi:hypothetical protein